MSDEQNALDVVLAENKLLRDRLRDAEERLTAANNVWQAQEAELLATVAERDRFIRAHSIALTAQMKAKDECDRLRQVLESEIARIGRECDIAPEHRTPREVSLLEVASNLRRALAERSET